MCLRYEGSEDQSWITDKGNKHLADRLMTEYHLEKRGMESDNTCKFWFEPGYSTYAHVNSQCALMKSLPKDRQEELLALHNRNYRNVVKAGVLRPSQRHQSNEFPKAAVQQPPKTRAKPSKFHGGLSQPAIEPRSQHNSI